MSKFIELEIDGSDLRMTVNCDHIISIHEPESKRDHENKVCSVCIYGGSDANRWYTVKKEYETLRGELTE